MYMTRKIINTITLLLFTAVAALIFSACKPAIGTPWYPRSASSSSDAFFITDIRVKGLIVTPVLAETPTDDADKVKKFSAAKTYTLNVPPEITEITAEDIAIKAVSSLSKMQAVPVEVTLNGDSVPLIAGQVVPATIKIADPDGNYAVQEKLLNITQNEPYDLHLTSLKISNKELVQNGVLQESVTVPYTVSSISAKDITASFTYGPHATVIPVELRKPSIKLYENEAVELTLSVKEQKGQYHAFECTVTVTRETRPDNADPVLEPESIFILGTRYEDGKALGVPMSTEKLTADDIVATFKDFGYLPVTLNPNPAEFGSNELIELQLSVPGLAGKYEKWETSITVKKDPTVLNNPKDKNGNKKYIVQIKTITEEISPFDYYKASYADFPASKFDEWVLVMPKMSGIIASYKFQDGSWSGNPEMVDNIPSEIGSGFKAISNVKIYRYKTRAARWSASGYAPEPNAHDDRFYFYRFTADASGGVKADSSLFCVDRYSKFLFYYSDPAELKTIVPGSPPVPRDWTDYAAASNGAHTQFTEPFYMSDPVGYVNKDGSVVIYSWLKDNINNARYNAQKNTAYTKKAGRGASQAGYSPYRENITTKRNEVESSINPAYTVALPVILGQPKPVRIQLNAAEEAVFTVKTAPAPDGEQLSYQWYKNTTQSVEGGEAIPGATGAVYEPDKSVETDCFVYCTVTNTNSTNGATETVNSRAVKLLIRTGSLAVDAEQPQIVKHPKSERFSISAPDHKRSVKLEIEARSPDKGTLSYQWYKNTVDTNSGGTAIDGATADSYSFTVAREIKTEYYYCQVTNTNDTVDGNKTASIATDTAQIEVEESYPVFFGCGEGNGSITAIYEHSLIDTGAYVKKGKKVTFIAQADTGYEILRWDGDDIEVTANKLSASITVDGQETVQVVFRKIPDTRKLTITAKKLENIDLGCYYNGWQPNYNKDHAYFVYNFKSQIFNTAAEYDADNYQSLWSIYNGEDTSNSFTQVSKIRKLAKGESITSSNATTKEFAQLPDTQFFRLDTKLVKYDANFANTTVDKQYLSGYDQSVVEFVYNKTKDEWTCQKANIDNNFVIENVTASFDSNFVLKRGQKKDFTISYYVDNAGNYAVGTAKVTYTLKWE